MKRRKEREDQEASPNGNREDEKSRRSRRRRGGKEDEKVAGTYVRYAGEKHPGGAPAVPPTFKVPLASGPCVPPRAPR